MNSLSDLLTEISVSNFPDGSFVNRDLLFGKYNTDSYDQLVSAQGMTHLIAVSRGTTDQRYNWAGEFLSYMESIDFNDDPVVT